MAVRDGDGKGFLVDLHGFEDNSIAGNRLALCGDSQVFRKAFESAEAHGQGITTVANVQGAVGRCLHHRTDFLVRKIQFPPVVGRARCEELVVALVEQTAGLSLEVRPVAVRQQVLPDGAGARHRPEKQLLAGHLFMPGPMAVSELPIVPVSPGEILKLAMHEEAIVVGIFPVAVDGHVPAVLGDRPRRGGNCVVVRNVLVSGQHELEVVAQLLGYVHPHVIGLIERLRVVPE